MKHAHARGSEKQIIRIKQRDLGKGNATMKYAHALVSEKKKKIREQTKKQKNAKQNRLRIRSGLHRVTQRGHNAIRACAGDNCNSVRACTGDRQKQRKQKKKETTKTKKTKTNKERRTAYTKQTK